VKAASVSRPNFTAKHVPVPLRTPTLQSARCGTPCELVNKTPLRLSTLEPLRENISVQWWPVAAIAAVALAGVVVVAAVLSSGGKSAEEQRSPGSPAPPSTRTVSPAATTAPACAPSGPQPTGERTLFDDLAEGASRDDPNFEATLTAAVSDDSAGAHAHLTLDMSVRAGDVAPKAFSILLPTKWGITPGCEIPIGLGIGALRWDVLLGREGNPCNEPGPLLFTMLNASTNTADTVEFGDSDNNGTPDYAEDKDHTGRADVVEKYPSFLNRLFPGRLPLRRTVGLFPYVNPPILAQSLAFQDLDGSEGTSLALILQDIGDPEAVAGKSGFSDYCTPTGFKLTDSGATYAGSPLYTNPPAGRYQLVLTAFGERDAEGDGIENALDTCPFDANVGNPRVKGEGDADEDGLDAACDPNDFENNPDQDGDGYLNRDDICPLVPSTQKDSDGDEIGDECDTSGNGPDVADGDVPLVVQAGEIVIR